jgi:Uma2 family endonuclease
MSISPHIADDAATPLMGKPVAVPTETIWRLTVDQYHEMVQTGILTEDDPVELLDGWLVPKMPKHPSHSVATQLVGAALTSILPEGIFVRSQEPITLAASEPEPDVVVVRGNPRRFRDAHPGPGDVVLIVEVAEASLQRDRTLKKAIYAEAGIATYWIVNLIGRCVEVYMEPSGPADHPDYRRRQELTAADSVSVLLDGREVARFAVSDVLP